MSRMRIGRVAAEADVSVPTVRYYERIGLLPEAERSASGYRRFEPGTVRRLRFIRRAQELGFSLQEIRELLELRAVSPPTRGEVQARAAAKLADLEARIADLERMRRAVLRLHEACRAADGRGSECPILEALEAPSVG